MRSSSKLFLGALLAAGMLWGCGGAKQTATETRLVWPGLPDTPRIAYVKTLKGEDDFSTGIGGVLNSLAGKQSQVVFQRPFDVAPTNDGRLYVTDGISGILCYDMNRRSVTVLGQKLGVDVKDPRGVAYGHGKLFVGAANLGQVLVINDAGETIGKIGRLNQFQNPVRVVLDTVRSRVYIVDNRIHQVAVYSEAGDSLFMIGRRGEGDGQFNFPVGAALDSKGNLYVVDEFNYRVEVFDTAGHFVRQFGKQGDAFGTFARPKGIALDSFDNIYVLDAVHNNFQIFNNAGELLMFVGHFSAGNDGFQNPVMMAIDRHNTIYVTDNLNARVQVFQLLMDQNTH